MIFLRYHYNHCVVCATAIACHSAWAINSLWKRMRLPWSINDCYSLICAMWSMQKFHVIIEAMSYVLSPQAKKIILRHQNYEQQGVVVHAIKSIKWLPICPIYAIKHFKNPCAWILILIFKPALCTPAFNNSSYTSNRSLSIMILVI